MLVIKSLSKSFKNALTKKYMKEPFINIKQLSCIRWLIS